MPYVAKVSSKGWIVIPKELRVKYDISPGDKVFISEEDERLTISSLPNNPITAFRGILKGYSLVEELKVAREEENAHEELRAGQLRSTDVFPE